MTSRIRELSDTDCQRSFWFVRLSALVTVGCEQEVMVEGAGSESRRARVGSAAETDSILLINERADVREQ